MSQKIKRIKKVEMVLDFGKAGQQKIVVEERRGISGKRLKYLSESMRKIEFQAKHIGIKFCAERCRYFTIEFER